MANTRDVIGDQATIDGLVSHTLTDFEDDAIDKLYKYSFYSHPLIESINLPSLESIQNYCIAYCDRLENVNIPNVEIINSFNFNSCFSLKNLNISHLKRVESDAFNYCYSLNGIDTSEVTKFSSNKDNGFGKLELPIASTFPYYFANEHSRTSIIDIANKVNFKTVNQYSFKEDYILIHLILRSAEMCTLSDTACFNGTPLENGIGWIYVPSDLVDTYKAASNWSTFANQIVSINEYPKRPQNETIADSWSDIFVAEDNGTYSTRYSIGDIKYVDIGGTQYPMQIIAFDKDILASGGTAKITWCGLCNLNKFFMDFDGNSNVNWSTCKIRKFLREIIYSQIESTVRNQIKEITKTYIHDYDVTSSITDTVFIPSIREMMGGGGNHTEDSGIDYLNFFTTTNSKMKRRGFYSYSNYWTRSSFYSNSYKWYAITSNGVGQSFVPNQSGNYILLCFCT